MKTREFILAVDLGTSATKAVLFDTALKQVAIARKGYPVHVPKGNWSEQEPEVVYQAVLAALREIAISLPKSGKLMAVAFSSQLYSAMVLGPDNQPLTNSLIWSDTRSAAMAQWIKDHPQALGIHQRTGCPVDAVYPLSKIRWFKENLDLPPGVLFISIKEYIIYRLTGQLVVDWSIASATGLFDIRLHQWDPAALSLLGITSQNLSELVSPRAILTGWEPDVLEQTGLPSGLPLVVGGGDGPLASIGLGAFDPQVLAVNVGTSAAARCILAEAKVDPQGRLWTYMADENLWVIGGIVSSGGIVYEWFLKNVLSAPGEYSNNGRAHFHQTIDALAASVPAGAEELLFIPYLSGEQCPAWNPATRGSIFGLDLKHHQGHFARAVLEGITRSIFCVAETIEETLQHPFREIRVAGGLTASEVWLQIAADMFGVTIALPDTVEGSARGAAVLALLSLGAASSITELPDLFVPVKHIQPRQENHLAYQEQHAHFVKLLEASRKYP